MVIIFFILIYDLLLKTIATHPVGHGFISIYPMKNTGAGISIFEGHNTVLLVINCISIFMLFNLYNRFSSIYLLVTIGGVAGNLYDRYIYGGVRDYLYIKGLFICNLADICIFLGLACFFLAFKINEMQNQSINKAPASLT